MVHHRLHIAVTQQILYIYLLEIAYADSPQTACLVCLFHRAPCGEIAFEIVVALAEGSPRLRCVDNHQVDVVEPQPFERAFDGGLRPVIVLDKRIQFGRDENLFTFQSASADAFAHATLVAVALRRVEMTVTDFHRTPYGFRRLVIVDHPRTESEFRDSHSVGEHEALR